jgi:hypothetical protein
MFLSSQVLRSIIFGGGFSNSQRLATRF